MTTDVTFREDIDRRSIPNVRNTLAVEGNVTIDQAVRNDLTVLWTPGTADDLLVLPTTGLIGTYLTIVNQSDTYNANIVNNATLWPVEAGQGMLFILAGDTWLPAANADIVESSLATKATYVYVDGELEYRPTYTEIIDGFTDTASGGTTVPTTPTISLCKGLFRAITISWDKQANLTNFARYEVQVSDDNVTWYSLQFDGTSWKDTLDANTSWLTEFIVHSNIPSSGTADDPSGQTLYYRVRRVTKASSSSEWSTSVSATTETVQAGDLAANSVYANNVVAGFLQTVFAEIDTLVVGYSGVGTPYVGEEGDRRILLTDKDISWQTYSSVGWISDISIGTLPDGDTRVDIGGMRFTGTLGGGDAIGTYTGTLGGGNATSTYTGILGGGTAFDGALGLLYTSREGLKINGSALIQGTITADKIDTNNLFAQDITFTKTIQSSGFVSGVGGKGIKLNAITDEYEFHGNLFVSSDTANRSISLGDDGLLVKDSLGNIVHDVVPDILSDNLRYAGHILPLESSAFYLSFPNNTTGLINLDLSQRLGDIDASLYNYVIGIVYMGVHLDSTLAYASCALNFHTCLEYNSSAKRTLYGQCHLTQWAGGVETRTSNSTMFYAPIIMNNGIPYLTFYVSLSFKDGTYSTSLAVNLIGITR